MQYAFAAPILPGKTDAAREWVETVLGSKRQEWNEIQQRFRAEEEYYFLQETPDGDMLIICGNGTWTPPPDILDPDNNEFDRWFVEQGIEVFGVDLMSWNDQPSQLLGRWKQEEPAQAPAAD